MWKFSLYSDWSLTYNIVSMIFGAHANAKSDSYQILTVPVSASTHLSRNFERKYLMTLS